MAHSYPIIRPVGDSTSLDFTSELDAGAGNKVTCGVEMTDF